MEYKTVKKNLNNITRVVKSVPSASATLRQLYIEEDWIDPTAKPTEEVLVELALGRIEQDVNAYGKFVSILGRIQGMDQIVKLLPRKNLLSLYILVDRR